MLRVEEPTRPCLGCGFCCMKAPCGVLTDRVKAALEDGWPNGCPELVFDEVEGRHWCGVILSLKTATDREKLKTNLSVGEGCCAGMNSWRREPLRDRTSGWNF